MKRIFYVLLMAAVGATGPAAAAETADQSDPTPLSDSIVVTANRVGMSAEESVWPVKILRTPAFLSEEGLGTALDGQAGIDVRSHGGFGSLSTLSGWGLFNRHMLLVYNGRVVKDYSLGGFNLSDFSGLEIERIEILKGPQSAFYGADAVGGVVNLITASSLADRVKVTVNRGSFGFEKYAADLSHRFGAVGIAGHAELGQSDNHRRNAGSERMAFSVRSDYLSGSGAHHVSVSARYFKDSLGVPGPMPGVGFIPVYGDEESWSLFDHQKDENYSIDLQYRLSDERLGDVQVDAFWEKKNLDYNSLYNYQFSYIVEDLSVDPPDSVLSVDSVDVLGRSIYNKRSSGLSGRYINRFRGLQIAGGVDYLSGSVRATTSDLSTATTVTGLFAPFEYSFDSYNFWKGGQDQFDVWSNLILMKGSWLRFDLSGRLQFVTGRQVQPSYNAGLVLSGSDWWQWKVGYAYAFRLPTIAEQFAEDVYTAGNEDLRPETSRSIISSLSLGFPDNKLSSRVTVFHQTVDSLIQYQLDWNTFLYVPENINRFKTTGVDIEVEAQLRRELSLALGGVIQSARQTPDAGVDYVNAYYVPDIKWRADLFGEYGRATYGLNLRYTSDRSILMVGETKTLAKVYEIGARMTVAVTSQVSVNLAGHDLTDRKRPDQFGFSLDDRDYPSPGRRLVLGVLYEL